MLLTMLETGVHDLTLPEKSLSILSINFCIDRKAEFVVAKSQRATAVHDSSTSVDISAMGLRHFRQSTQSKRYCNARSYMLKQYPLA